MKFFKNAFSKSLMVLFVMSATGILFRNSLMNFYFWLTPYYSISYNHNKNLILPYFDEFYYKRTYEKELETTGESPIDHFLRRSCRLGGGEYDPNDWFNVTLYKNRLWPCCGNPFVDFLQQSEAFMPKDAPLVDVYSNKDQLFRAWMAVEGLLRKKKFQVILTLPDSLKNDIPLRFCPQIKRGLKLHFSKDPLLSFYQSPFLKEPEKYAFTDLPVQEYPRPDQAISRIQLKKGCEYLAHRLYKCTPWKKEGLLNPCMLNFGFFHTEPIVFSPFGSTEKAFQNNMKRVAPGFDLLFLNTDIKAPNLRIIPGFMATFIESHEKIPKQKVFGVSFLLSLGGKGLNSFKTRDKFIYHFRKEVFEREKNFSLPTHFFISKRDVAKYPSDLQDRALPDQSKKWIFGTQFTIAIENVYQDHYFSEKLIDCFFALTIPIYIGCPNITDYFDARGMLIAKTPDDVVRIANTLTPESYAKMLPYLLENKRRAESYIGREKNFIQNFFNIS